MSTSSYTPLRLPEPSAPKGGGGFDILRPLRPEEAARRPSPFAPRSRMARDPVPTDATAVRTVAPPPQTAPPPTVRGRDAVDDSPLMTGMARYAEERRQLVTRLQSPLLKPLVLTQRLASGIADGASFGHGAEIAGALVPGMDAEDFADEALWEEAGGTLGAMTNAAGILGGSLPWALVGNEFAAGLGGGRAATALIQAAQGGVEGALWDTEGQGDRGQNALLGALLGGGLGAVLPQGPSKAAAALSEDVIPAARLFDNQPIKLPPSTVRRVDVGDDMIQVGANETVIARRAGADAVDPEIASVLARMDGGVAAPPAPQVARDVVPTLDEALEETSKPTRTPVPKEPWWRRAFVYEAGMDRFPGKHTATDPRYTLADDVYLHTARAGRAWGRAKRRTDAVLIRMAGDGGRVPQASYDAFRTLFHAWRDALSAVHARTRNAGELVQRFNDLKAKAPPAVLHAYNQQRRIVAYVSKLEQRSGESQTVTQFFHRGIADLPETVYDITDHTGRVITPGFSSRNHRLLYSYNMRNANETLFDTLVETNGVGILDLAPEVQQALRAGGETLVDGVPHRLLDLSAYKASVGRAWEYAMRGYQADIMLPSAVIERMEKLGVQQAPPRWFQLAAQAPTQSWKQAVLFHRLGSFMARNFLGDGTALWRSFPGAVLMQDGRAAGRQVLGDLAVRMRARLHTALADRGLIEPMPENRGFLEAVARHEQAADLNVAGSDFVSGEMKLGQMEAALSGPPAQSDTREILWDTLRSVMTGQPHRSTLGGVREFLGSVGIAAQEIEGFMRTWSYVYQLRRGVASELAAKRTREAFVDYARFTYFENEYLRKFALPFYSFARQSIPNWAKALAGNDVAAQGVGERVATTVSAWSVVAAPVLATAWNEQFFPDVERNLSPDQRQQFHIIMGDPRTGIPLKDEHGRPMIAGFGLPADLVPEVLGFGSWGNMASNAFGLGVDGDGSMLARFQRVEEWRTAPEATRAVFDGMAGQVRRLLNPVAGVGYAWLTGEDLAFGGSVAADRRIDFSLRNLVPAYGHARRYLPGVGMSESQRRFEEENRRVYGTSDPFYNLNIQQPIDRDAELRWKLIAMLQFATDGREDPAVRQVLIKLRELRGANPHVPAPLEESEVRRLASEASDPEAAAQLLRAHGRLGYRSTRLQDMWDAMGIPERERFLRNASPGDVHAMLFFMHGGQDYFTEEP